MIPGVIVGIDPGLAKTAVVVLRGGEFIRAKTFTTTGDTGKPNFPSVMERGSTIAAGVTDALDHMCWNVVAVAIESYEDFGGGHLRKSKKSNAPIPNRWTTPAVCALLGYRLEMLGYNVVWQRPSLVMAHYREYKARWAAGVTGIVPGDQLLTNDHLRSAACHALAYADARRFDAS
jgi:hypothetical protein